MHFYLPLEIAPRTWEMCKNMVAVMWRANILSQSLTKQKRFLLASNYHSCQGRVPAALNNCLLQQTLPTVPWFQLEWAAAKEVWQDPYSFNHNKQYRLPIVYTHTYTVYTDLLTIPRTRMKSSYLKWDMSIPNKYGLTFCWTSWNKYIIHLISGWKRNHQVPTNLTIGLQTSSSPSRLLASRALVSGGHSSCWRPLQRLLCLFWQWYSCCRTARARAWSGGSCTLSSTGSEWNIWTSYSLVRHRMAKVAKK